MPSNWSWRRRTKYGKQPDSQTLSVGHGHDCRRPGDHRRLGAGRLSQDCPGHQGHRGQGVQRSARDCAQLHHRQHHPYLSREHPADYLGTTVAEIRVPVSFRYHLRLSDPWRLAARDQVCLVLAPRIRPSLPPAIHTAEMERRAESGWARFDKNDQLDELERSMTPTLEQRARDPAHVQLVREACRQSVAAFVKKWLLREGQWRSDRFTSIVVVFPDEASVSADQELLQLRREPTLKLDQK